MYILALVRMKSSKFSLVYDMQEFRGVGTGGSKGAKIPPKKLLRLKSALFSVAKCPTFS